MEIVYSIFIGIIVGKIASKIDGIVLQCRRDRKLAIHCARGAMNTA
jgi:hypothetical protein